MNHFTQKLLLYMGCLLFSLSMFAQERQITGTVTDEKNMPIPGVNILVEGTSRGTLTNMEGEYDITASEGQTLIFSFMGMKTIEVLIGNNSEYNVAMEEDGAQLDEIVIVGYGGVKKSNLTGAVTSVDMDDVPKIATNDVASILTGRVAGLSIRQNSAAPGGEFQMAIRGAASTGAGNQPLYVVDGFPGGDINTINPDDIRSIEVLKDASATAIYGARAANGVILISTKRGRAGEMNINLNSSISMQKMANPYDMVSARDYMQLSNEFFQEEWLYNNNIAPYGNIDPSTVGSSPRVAFTNEQINNAVDKTDWFDEITRTGIVSEQSISINGGEDKVRYLFSLGNLKQKGVIINSGTEQYFARLNLELDLAEWISTGISASGSQKGIDKIIQAGGPAGAGMIYDAMMYPKYLPVYDEEGNYAINPDHASTANPVSWREVENNTNTYRMLVNNFWNVKFTNNLVFRVNWGVNSSYGKNNYFLPKSHLLGQQENSKASIDATRNQDYLLDAILTYDKQIFGNHQFRLMGGYAYQKFNSELVHAGNSDFITDIFGTNNLNAGGAATRTVGSSKSITKYLSYFGRLNYDIADKYLFTFTFRADGSDRFGEENKFGYFPSGAFAWKISEENFMENQNWVSNLKIRLSAGQTGNAEIGGNTYGFYATGANYVFGNSLVNGISENQLANPKLKWETTTEFNVGLDWGLFNQRISGSFEYYNKVISDLLDWRTVGSYYPVQSVADNIGKTQSEGFEIQITSTNITSENFHWTTDLNLYQFRDRWKERNPFSILSVFQGPTDPLHISYGYLSDGLVQEGESIPHLPDAPPGSINVRDINGWLTDGNGNPILDENGNRQLSGAADGNIDDADKVIIRNGMPDLNFGINNTFTYKAFDLSLFFYGELGRQLNNVTRMDFLRADRFRFSDNVRMDSFDRWTSSNPNGIYPSGLYPTFEAQTDFFVEDADFVRLKNLTLGYTLPESLTNRNFNARIYADAQNLFVLTNYSGSDPETDSFSAYPNQKTYTIGINLSF